MGYAFNSWNFQIPRRVNCSHYCFTIIFRSPKQIEKIIIIIYLGLRFKLNFYFLFRQGCVCISARNTIILRIRDYKL